MTADFHDYSQNAFIQLFELADPVRVAERIVARNDPYWDGIGIFELAAVIADEREQMRIPSPWTHVKNAA